MSEEVKRKVGRPKGSGKGRYKHKYKKQYAAMLVEHMSKGFSFESFGGIVNAGMYVLYRWVEQEQDFSEAKLLGMSHCRLFWEKVGIKGLIFTKDGPQVNAGLWRINMKNRFGWTDTQKIEHSVDKQDSRLVIDLSGNSNFKKIDDKEKKK